MWYAAAVIGHDALREITRRSQPPIRAADLLIKAV